MNFPFFIARRYLFSKKSTHVINVISSISVIGVAVATMALVIVLSVFNGFHDLVASLFTSFDPQLKVVPVEGKTAPADDPILTKIRLLPQVDVATETVEDQALAIYNDHQAMVKIKGVDDNFAELSHITDILYGDGSFSLHAANLEYGTVGIRLAQNLGIGAQWDGFLKIYAPKKEGQLDMTNPGDGFVVDSLNSPGVLFAVKQAKYDKNYIITSISFARNLFGQQGMLSDLELRLKPGSNLDAVKAEMQQIACNKYKVLDRFEQQEDTFKIMSIEKMIAYIFLTFILVVACFNIIGSLSMLIIDKKRLKLKESGLPQIVIDQTPWYMRRTKIPVVKAKIGPKIQTLISETTIFDSIPVKKEIKAVVSGIYITEIKSVRGGAIPAPPKKKGFFARFKKEK